MVIYVRFVWTPDHVVNDGKHDGSSRFKITLTRVVQQTRATPRQP